MKLHRIARRVRILALSALVGTASLLAARTGGAQPDAGEAERRQNARALFDKGDELQRKGDYAQAIEKYDAARKQFPAPTIVLRIAQCQANMGKLIESAETYRGVINWPLSPQDPPQFRQSKIQAEAELPQVESKIPKVTLQIKPATSGLQIQFDGQSLDPAFVGVARPLNPGPHRVVAFAPGFATGEKSVILKERDAVTMTLELVPSQTTGTPLPPPAVYEDPSRKEPPPVTPPPTPVVAGPQEPARIALMLAADVGALFPTGTLPDETTSGTLIAGGLNITERASTGPAFGAGVGIRIHHVILQFHYQGAVLKNPFPDVSAATHYLGGTFGYLNRLDAPALLSEVSLGWRNLSYDKPLGSAGAPAYEYSGFNLGGGLGVSIPVANNTFRIIPKATVALGVFRDSQAASSTIGSSTSSSSFQAFWGLALAFQYDPLPLSK